MLFGRRRSILIAGSLVAALSTAALTGVVVSAQASSVATSGAAAIAAAAPGTVVAATPPMGWNDWYAFQCNLNEQLVEQTADAMVTSGMAAAGYDYVNLDDCWLSHQRDSSGNLQADPAKFPDGIKAVADYVHARGLKLGIYEDVGIQTCAGYPGSYGHVKQDAGSFSSWGIDFVKADWCNVPFGDFPGMDQQQVAQKLYTQYGEALRGTGRPMVLSVCEWDPGLQPWTWAPGISNMWRTNVDYGDSWGSILSKLDQEAALARYAGPGHWNDPDILQVGLGGMSTAEDRAHFSAWAMLAAPLLAGNDLRSMSPATRAILTNRDVIAIDQDPLGAQATRISHSADADVWTKPLANGDRAVMLLNRGRAPLDIATTAGAAGLVNAGAYAVRDLWAHTTSESAGTIAASVPGHSAMLYRVAPLHGDISAYQPVTDVSITDYHLTKAGQTFTATATFRNDGRPAVTDATFNLAAPEGWQVRGASISAGAVPRGGTLRGSWQVTVPAGTSPGTYLLTGTASYRYDDGLRGATTSSTDITDVAQPYASLAATYDDAGISSDGNVDAANYDGIGNSYSEQALTAAGLPPGATVVHDGIHFTWPDLPPGTPENTIANGQVIQLSGSGSTLGFLGTSANGNFGGTGTVYYTDGTISSFNLLFYDYWNPPGPDNDTMATTPYINSQGLGGRPRGRRDHAVGVYYAGVPITPGKTVQAVALPSGATIPPSGQRIIGMHIFAIGIG